jgi:AhpD family alkylhydroperoxidase
MSAQSSDIAERRQPAVAESNAGVLETKTIELIALAVAATLRCDDCLTVHTAAAIRVGATQEELAEALATAAAVNAGAALVYSARVLDSWTAKAA